MQLSRPERSTVLAIRDTLIPNCPGRSSDDAFMIDVRRVLEARPDLQTPFREGIACLLDQEVTAEQVVTSRHSAVLKLVVTGAHYTNPTVAEAIGYDMAQLRTRPLEGPELAELHAQLRKVVSRGRCYRPVPSSA